MIMRLDSQPLVYLATVASYPCMVMLPWDFKKLLKLNYLEEVKVVTRFP